MEGTREGNTSTDRDEVGRRGRHGTKTRHTNGKTPREAKRAPHTHAEPRDSRTDSVTLKFQNAAAPTKPRGHIMPPTDKLCPGNDMLHTTECEI